MDEMFLLEDKNAKLAWVPVNMNDGAITGLRIPVGSAKRVAFAVQMGASTAALAHFNLKQHDAVSSGNTKAIAVGNPYYVKTSAATSYTKVVPVSATDDYDLSTTFASLGGVVVFEILAEDLDVENGFAWVSICALDSTADKLSSCVAVLEPTAKPGYLGNI